MDAIQQYASPPSYSSTPSSLPCSPRPVPANATDRIVRDNLTSALILEDDVDWDIRLRPQLRNLARSTQSLIQPVAHTHHFADPSFRSPESDALPSDMHLDALPVVTPPRDSPYGDGWDLLWLGHCGMQFPTSVGRGASPRGRVVQLDDPTCPERRHLFSLAPEPFLLRDQYPDRTRVVHHARGGSCTLAYAVSQHGARALLHRVGLLDSSSGGKTAQDTPDPYDLRVRAFCDGPSDPSAPNPPRSLCLTVQPPLFNHHRPAGPKTALSDVYDYGAGDVERDASDMIRWSTRLNADVLIRGGDVYRDGLPDADPDEVGDDIM